MLFFKTSTFSHYEDPYWYWIAYADRQQIEWHGLSGWQRLHGKLSNGLREPEKRTSRIFGTSALEWSKVNLREEKLNAIVVFSSLFRNSNRCFSLSLSAGLCVDSGSVCECVMQKASAKRRRFTLSVFSKNMFAFQM